MTTGPGTGRVSTSETVRGLLAALQTPRTPSPPECSVTIGTTAKHGSAADPEPKRLHTWEVTVRGEDVQACSRLARLIDSELAAGFASELDHDTLGAQLAASIVKGQK